MAGRGTYGAYRQLTPTKTDFGDSMDRYARGMISIEQGKQDKALKQQQLDQSRKASLLKAQQDQYNKDRDYKFKISQELSKEMSALQPVTTGVSSIDEINAQYFSQSTAELGAIHREIMSNPNQYNNPDLVTRRNNINNSPKIIEAFQKQLTTGYQEITEGMNDGTLSKANVATMDKMEALLGPVETENGQKAYRFTYKNHPKTGQLMVYGYDTKNKQFKISAPNVIQGFELSDRIPLVNKDEYIKNKLSLLGKNQKRAGVAGGTATVQRWDSNLEDMVTDMVEAELIEGKGPSNTAKSLWVDGYNNEPGSQVNNAKLIDDVINEIKTGYDQTITGFKPPSESSDSYTKEINKAKGKRAAEVQQLQSQISLMKDTKTGKPFKEKIMLDDDSGRMKEVVGFNVPDMELPMGEGGKVRINQLYLDEQSGEIYYKGSMLRGKVPTPPNKRGRIGSSTSDPSTPVWKEISGSSTDVISEVANEYGFNDSLELEEYLRRLQGSSTSPVQGDLNELPD